MGVRKDQQADWIDELVEGIRGESPDLRKFGARIGQLKKEDGWAYIYDSGANDIPLATIYEAVDVTRNEIAMPFSAVCSGFAIKTDDPMQLYVDGIQFNPHWIDKRHIDMKGMYGVVIRGLPIMRHTLDFVRPMIRECRYDLFAIAPDISEELRSTFLMVADATFWDSDKSLRNYVQEVIFKYEDPMPGRWM